MCYESGDVERGMKSGDTHLPKAGSACCCIQRSVCICLPKRMLGWPAGTTRYVEIPIQTPQARVRSMHNYSNQAEIRGMQMPKHQPDDKEDSGQGPLLHLPVLLKHLGQCLSLHSV